LNTILERRIPWEPPLEKIYFDSGPITLDQKTLSSRGCFILSSTRTASLPYFLCWVSEAGIFDFTCVFRQEHTSNGLLNQHATLSHRRKGIIAPEMLPEAEPKIELNKMGQSK